MLQGLVQDTILAALDLFMGAAPFERGPSRRGWRNGYKPRTFKTRVGKLMLRHLTLRNAFRTEATAGYFVDAMIFPIDRMIRQRLLCMGHIVASAVVSLPLVGCAGTECGLAARYANLSVIDSSSKHALISPTQVRIRNIGSVSAEGIVSISIIDSLGNTLIRAPRDQVVAVPAADLGGADGVSIPIEWEPVLRNRLDSLIRSEEYFGLRAAIYTTGCEADPTDNVGIVDVSPYLQMLPHEIVTIPTHIGNRGSGRRHLYIDVLTIPAHTRLLRGPPSVRRVTAGDDFVDEIHVITPESLAHGSVVHVRYRLVDVKSDTVVFQRDRIAVYDSIPPHISSYRAVLLADGRIAIQVHVGDQHAGISEIGVATEYSVDGGKTWRRQVHRAFEDDFGRPALFETVLSMPEEWADVFVGLDAVDRVGNSSTEIPADAHVFKAPANAEKILDWAEGATANGNLLFSTEAVARQSKQVESAVLGTRLATGHSPIDPDRMRQFEQRRIRELGNAPQFFKQSRVDLARFNSLIVQVTQMRVAGDGDRTVLHLRNMR